jgi:hypothetical protein
MFTTRQNASPANPKSFPLLLPSLRCAPASVMPLVKLQLDLAAASAQPVLGDLGAALNGAYLRVLTLDPGPSAP